MRNRIAIVLIFFLAVVQVKASDTLRVMTYNLLNYGNVTSYCTNANNSFLDKEKPLQRIVEFIQPDIAGFCELGANTFVQQRLLDSVFNADGNNTFAKAQSMNTAGSSIVSMLYYNQEKLALKSQHVLNSDVRDIILYKLYYRDPNLAQTQDTAFLSCIVSHLKAGSTSSDRSTRATMTQNAMYWIEQNGGPGNYLFMGDLNVKNSSEAAYQNLVNYSVPSLRFLDPINVPGNWNNSSSFAHVHTQSTHTSGNGCASSGGLDDRFDFILASASIMNGSKHYQYINGSYTTPGNDGNHFNGAITSGSNSSAPASIINDLYTMSDHLPLFLDLEIDQQGAFLVDNAKDNWGIQFNNPVQNNLTIQRDITHNKDMLLIQVVSINGKMIFSGTMDSKQIDVDVSSWPKGMYIIRLQDYYGNIFRKKIIKI
jgi:endonuclease/exonuclease/phosphatase family metal-dependent hydrolase